MKVKGWIVAPYKKALKKDLEDWVCKKEPLCKLMAQSTLNRPVKMVCIEITVREIRDF